VNGHLDDLASKALLEVAARSGSQEYHTSNAPLVGRILNAAMGRSDESLRDAAQGMIAQGIPAEVITDDIVPRAARMMGEEWVRDMSGFASVTLGSLGLQSLVRELGARWTADNAKSAHSAVLLWMPQSAQHTLGATVVSTQLRRMGHSVQFAPRSSLADLSQALKSDTFDAVFVSASMSETASDVGAIVEKVKTHDPALPVVVGGTILKQTSNLVDLTGADIATSDLECAAQFFSVEK
jgi:methanogenic corrinoid protein MtbC1